MQHEWNEKKKNSSEMEQDHMVLAHLQDVLCLPIAGGKL